MKTVWVTKTGQRVKIREMSDQHLENTIAMLRRKAEPMRLLAMADGERVLCSLNGEMAQLCVEQDLDRLANMDAEEFISSQIEQWPYLLKEQARRKRLYAKAAKTIRTTTLRKERNFESLLHT